MTYNLSAINVLTNQSGVVGTIQGVNTYILNGYLGAFIWLTILAILLITFLSTTGDFKSSGTATAFIMFSLSLTLVALGMLSPWFLYVSLIATAIGLFSLFKRD